MSLNVLSLCSGYAGLDLAAEAAYGPINLVAVADVDPGATTILAHNHPHTPNLGDITGADWTTLGPIDLVTAGYPCQPLSLAGRRAGLDDERWLWDDGVFPAIRDLRPGRVVLENVPGHLSLGFGRVLGDLASIGYDARWRCVRASDVGAPHRRERVFIVAEPADATRVGHGHTRPAGVRGLPPSLVRGGAGADGVKLFKTPTASDGSKNHGSQHPDKRKAGGHGPRLSDEVGHLLPTPRTSDTSGAGQHGGGRMDLRTAVTLLPTPRATDGTKGGPNQRGSSGDLMLPSAVQLMPTPTATPYGNNQSSSPNAAVRPSPDSLARSALLPTPMSADGGADRGSTAGNGLRNVSREITAADTWGEYAPAIARWERVMGRPAPSPTEVGAKGGRRLSPRFVEFLMGLPAGWVCDVPGLTRNQQLKALGNGVVWQQGAHALRLLDAQVRAAA